MILLAKGRIATAATPAYTIVKPGGSANGMQPAAAATDKLIGVNADVAKAIGEFGDVVVAGEALVLAGAAFAEGDLLTSDAQGRAITATAGAGSNVRTIGYALEAATAANQVVPIMVVPGSFQG
jgi:hypothetical protein